MAKLQFIKRAQFAPSVTSVCLIQADIYSSGRQKYAFLTFNNPEGIWHHEGIAKITPYNEDKKPLRSFGLRIDLTMIPPGGFFSYPEEIPLPIEAEDFNFEFLKIDGIQAPEYTPVRAFEDEPKPIQAAAAPATAAAEGLASEPKPAYEGPAPKPVREATPKKGARKGAKHIEIIDFSHRRIRTPMVAVSTLIALALTVGCSIFVSQYPKIDRGDGTEAFLRYTSYTWPDTGELCYAIEDADDNYDYAANSDRLFTVPSHHNGLPVYIIDERAFDYCINIVDLDLRGVKFIGTKAFQGCTNISRVALSYGTNVASDAFPSTAQLIYM